MWRALCAVTAIEKPHGRSFSKMTFRKKPELHLLKLKLSVYYWTDILIKKCIWVSIWQIEIPRIKINNNNNQVCGKSQWKWSTWIMSILLSYELAIRQCKPVFQKPVLFFLHCWHILYFLGRHDCLCLPTSISRWCWLNLYFIIMVLAVLSVTVVK